MKNKLFSSNSLRIQALLIFVRKIKAEAYPAESGGSRGGRTLAMGSVFA
jgi:hypothetical protein